MNSLRRELVDGAIVTVQEMEEAVGELRRLAAARPTLSGPIELLADVLPVLFTGAVAGTLPELTAERAVAKLTDGIPLLCGEPVDIDAAMFRQRCRDICAALPNRRDEERPHETTVVSWPEMFEPAELIGSMLSRKTDIIHALAETNGLNVELVGTVLRLASYPVLSSFNQSLSRLRSSFHWQHGYCPHCGSWPLLGEFRGLEQLRILRCGLCAAEWEFSRLQCPFCETRDHKRLGYFHVDGEGQRYRVSTCDGCRRYVKMASTLSALNAVELLVTDAATMHLDLAAAERGFESGC